MKLHNLVPGLMGLLLMVSIPFSAYAADPVRIGLIEPFSGPIAAIGLEILDNFEFAIERINSKGGVLGGRMLEVVALDNAMNAEKTTQQVKKAIDRGIRFISQGIGSNHALNIIKQLDKHNKRNPDKAVLYLNHSAVTTAFTNELCSFWHFRFDANVDMKVAGLATQIGRDPSIKKIYMMNQNYAYGKSFQAVGRRMIKERTNAELVGDDLIVPFGKVLDFTPYVAKVKASGADTVLTGNWGPDLVRFVKATAEAGLDVQFYTIYGGLPTSVNGYGVNDGMAVKIKQITEMHENDAHWTDRDNFESDYLSKYERSWYGERGRYILDMFVKALEKAGTDDPKAVAYALEGMTHPGPNGELLMRAEDHQIQMPMVISSIDDQAPRKMIYAGKNVGVGWKTDGWISRSEISQPTTCKMKRPA